MHKSYILFAELLVFLFVNVNINNVSIVNNINIW